MSESAAESAGTDSVLSDGHGQLLLEALQEQRNTALNNAALAVARSIQFQRENAKLRKELADLRASQKE